MKRSPCKRRLLIVAAILVFGLSQAGAMWAGNRSRPAPGSRPLDTAGRMQISPGDRCPVCAMTVDKHRKFASAIALDDGTTYYFCGTGCMIRSWRHPKVFLDLDKAQLKKPVVREYFTGEEIDARKAFWVAGSDIVGPMGPALVPLKSKENLNTFKRRHGGKTVFRLEELTDDRWRAITGKPAVP